MAGYEPIGGDQSQADEEGFGDYYSEADFPGEIVEIVRVVPRRKRNPVSRGFYVVTKFFMDLQAEILGEDDGMLVRKSSGAAEAVIKHAVRSTLADEGFKREVAADFAEVAKVALADEGFMQEARHALVQALRDEDVQAAVRELVKEVLADEELGEGLSALAAPTLSAMMKDAELQTEVGEAFRQGITNPKTSAALRKLTFDGANAAINPFFRHNGSPSRADKLAAVVGSATKRAVAGVKQIRCDQVDLCVEDTRVLAREVASGSLCADDTRTAAGDVMQAAADADDSGFLSPGAWSPAQTPQRGEQVQTGDF